MAKNSPTGSNVIDILKGAFRIFASGNRFRFSPAMKGYIPAWMGLKKCGSKNLFRVSEKRGVDCKLLDFGISKILDPLAHGPHTLHQGPKPLTLEYASPEQIKGEATTTATDTYSLGIVLFELLTGARPFSQKTLGPEGAKQAIMNLDPPPPSQVKCESKSFLGRLGTAGGWLSPKRVPKDLDNIVLKALRKDPRRRYGSVSQMGADMERYLNGFPVLARPETLRYLCVKIVQRHKMVVSSAMMGLVLLMGFTAVLYFQKQETSQQRDRAERVSQLLLNTFKGADPYMSNGQTATAKDLLDQAVKNIDQDLNDEPLTKAELLTTMAVSYKTLQNLPKAKKLLQEAQQIQMAHGLTASPEFGDTLSYLAEIAGAEHRLKASEAGYLRALVIYEEKRPQNHINMGMCLAGLATTISKTGRNNEAYPIFQRAITRLTANGTAPAKAVLANTYDRLGKALSDEGHYQNAERNFRQALALKEAIHHGDHPGIANVLNNLAVLCNKQSKNEEAEALYLRSLALTKKAFGPTHLQTLTVINNLGKLFLDQNQFEKAETFQAEYISLLQEHYPNDHWGLIVGLSNMGTLSRKNGFSEKAQDYFLRAYNLSGEMKDLPPLRRVPCLVNLAAAYGDLKQFDQAEPLFNDALRLVQQYLRPDHQHIAKVMSAWGAMRLKQERWADARDLYLSALLINVKAFEPHHPINLRNLESMVEACRNDGQTEWAVRFEPFLTVSQPTGGDTSSQRETGLPELLTDFERETLSLAQALPR